MGELDLRTKILPDVVDDLPVHPLMLEVHPLMEAAVTVDTVSVPVILTHTAPIIIDMGPKRMRRATPKSRAPRSAGTHVAMQTQWMKYKDVSIRWSGLPLRKTALGDRVLVALAAGAAMVATAMLAAAGVVVFA